MGDSYRAKEGEVPPRDSALFDGETLRLRGVRGETLGVQVVLKGREQHPVSLELPADVCSVEGFRVRSLEVREPSTSMYGPSHGTGRYPDVLVPTKGPVPALERAFFDVAIREKAPAGRFDGRITIGPRSFPVRLRVDPISIHPELNPLVWVFYHPKEIARLHHVADDDGPQQIAIENKYHELFRRHGAYLATDLGPERFAPRRRFMHDVRYWPVSVDLSSDEKTAADVRRWLSLFAGSTVQPFTIPVDEPKSEAQKRRASHIADVIGQAGGGAPRLLRAVTDAVSPIYGNLMEAFFSPKNIPASAAYPHKKGQLFFTYNGRPPEAGSMILDTDGTALRTWGWIAYRYGVELWYAWEGLYFSDRYNGGGPTDVFQQAVTFDERRKGGEDFGNGDGVLAYPGPLPSLRLKALRRGLQDRLLLLELERCGGGQEARAIAEKIVPRALGEADSMPSWPTDEPSWEVARERLLDQIAWRCHVDS